MLASDFGLIGENFRILPINYHVEKNAKYQVHF
jgi:hypothetical protein